MMSIMLNKFTRKQITHERIVDVASRAIRRAGTNGVGVADMMKEAGLTHGGFYAHFESRDALVVEAIQRAWIDSSTAIKTATARRMACGEGHFAALVHSYLHESHLEQIECGCVVAALASEMPRMSDAVLNEARRNVNALVELVRSTLPQNADPARAEDAAAMMVGALQLARVLGGQRGRDLLVRTSEQLITQFEPFYPN
ncbi:TetR/AcrR family transcriptional regulator [Dickeya zeae]|nr:TetR/AcrR family transcriptional regulator [Dickeya zeae]AUQ25380.1 TetR/AcrR family transcriptional regulator [Dickeya zeae]UJR54315.1 TetR/AcrR family transcriptional regulator [Dickeya zeae MS1]UJR58454.1 TetR/AcrR family transcriptional regulator [Dickeya zeae]